MPKLLGTTIDGRTVERGTALSLNLSRTTFIGVPGFSLNEAHPTASVPQDIPQASLNLLRTALDRGLLVLGTSPVMNKAVSAGIIRLYQEIDEAPRPKDVAETLFKVHSGKKRVHPYGPSEVMGILLDHELRTQCRDEFVNWLADLRDQTPGPGKVMETNESAVKVGLPRNLPGEGEVGSIRTIGKAIAGSVPTKPADSKVVDELF